MRKKIGNFCIFFVYKSSITKLFAAFSKNDFQIRGSIYSKPSTKSKDFVIYIPDFLDKEDMFENKWIRMAARSVFEDINFVKIGLPGQGETTMPDCDCGHGKDVATINDVIPCIRDTIEYIKSINIGTGGKCRFSLVGRGTGAVACLTYGIKYEEDVQAIFAIDAYQTIDEDLNAHVKLKANEKFKPDEITRLCQSEKYPTLYPANLKCKVEFGTWKDEKREDQMEKMRQDLENPLWEECQERKIAEPGKADTYVPEVFRRIKEAHNFSRCTKNKQTKILLAAGEFDTRRPESVDENHLKLMAELLEAAEEAEFEDDEEYEEESADVGLLSVIASESEVPLSQTISKNGASPICLECSYDETEPEFEDDEEYEEESADVGLLSVIASNSDVPFHPNCKDLSKTIQRGNFVKTDV
eukprot:GHVP01062295.1.p1 GENE.GHVP01062295.1~~GHVP01062295.1.p1  ORF type:complete len:414 (+),score=78.35 GHVP01062295.1:187-1428(+)